MWSAIAAVMGTIAPRPLGTLGAPSEMLPLVPGYPARSVGQEVGCRRRSFFLGSCLRKTLLFAACSSEVLLLRRERRLPSTSPRNSRT